MDIPVAGLWIALASVTPALSAQQDPPTVKIVDVRDLTTKARAASGDDHAGVEFLARLEQAFERLAPELSEDNALDTEPRGYLLARLPKDGHAWLDSFVGSVRKAPDAEVGLQIQCLSAGRIDEKALGLQDGAAVLEDREALVAFLRKAQAAKLRLHALPARQERVLHPWTADVNLHRSGEEEDVLAIDGLCALLSDGAMAVSLRSASAPDDEGPTDGEDAWETRFQIRPGQTAVRAVTRGGDRILFLLTRQQ